MKERLDILVVKKGFFSSREKAKAAILEGNIFVDGVREDKVGMKFKEDSEIVYKGKDMPFVSRGGFKLKKAVDVFSLNLNEKVCIDIGASTGGFTDCMLQNGAKKVFSVDVGYGQFDWRLRNDERVVCMEKTNIRYVTKDDIKEELDFASCDVSFISLTKILEPVSLLLKEKGEMVCLIKPQFEAGKENVGKNGVVRDKKVQKEVIEKVYDFSIEKGFVPFDLSFSPIKGPKGNIEFLIYLKKNSKEEPFNRKCIESVVDEAHEELMK